MERDWRDVCVFVEIQKAKRSGMTILCLEKTSGRIYQKNLKKYIYILNI